MKKIFITLLITLSLLSIGCESTNRVEASVSNNFEIVSKEEIDPRVTAYIIKDKVYKIEYIMIYRYSNPAGISITPRIEGNL